MTQNEHKLGDLKSSEDLLKEIYVELREKLKEWAQLTQQTPQARMGYIGQHLVSVVTGYPGNRSGARGKDLNISKTEFAEIKTCYRVDQLGKCITCKATVSSIEEKCPSCGSKNIQRNDDSKWLISIRNDEEFKHILDAKYYYLVLFEFVDISSESNTDIQASIWQVDPNVPGFGLCMIDYYLNIKSKSKSGAPFNLWPYQLKFDIMRALLIYRSTIKGNGVIVTSIFPSLRNTSSHEVKSLELYARANNLNLEKAKKLAKKLGVKTTSSGLKDILITIQEYRIKTNLSNDILADEIADVLYLPNLVNVKNQIPDDMLDKYPQI